MALSFADKEMAYMVSLGLTTGSISDRQFTRIKTVEAIPNSILSIADVLVQELAAVSPRMPYPLAP